MLIFYFSAQTSSELRLTFPFIENFNPGHIAAYFVLALLAFNSFNQSGTKRPFLATLGLTIIYGVTDEFHQAFVPTRQPEIADLLRDTIGAMAALLIIFTGQIIAKKLRRKKDEMQ